MTRPLTIIVFAMALLAQAHAATAQDAPRVYIGGGYEIVNLTNFDPKGITLFGESNDAAFLRAGVVVQRYIAVEAEIATGISNEENDGIADYNSRLGGFARLRLPIGPAEAPTGWEMFGRIGFATTQIDSGSVAGRADLDGLAWGFGAAYAFGRDDRFQLRADYTRYNFGDFANVNTDEDLDAGGFGIGLSIKF